jgi:hypothetical protein
MIIYVIGFGHVATVGGAQLETNVGLYKTAKVRIR